MTSEDALKDYHRRWAGEFADCAACDARRMRYSLTPMPTAGTFRGRAVRKGARVCFEHRALLDPKVRESLKRFTESRSS